MSIFRSVKRWRLLILALLLSAIPASSFAGIFISVNIAPPPLPIYSQPLCPGDGYIWTPGYWAYGPEGYFWVPGTWVIAPQVGFLWTPGYWGWGGGHYLWNGGYWGPHVGYYGGVNYGFGYMGVGFVGGRWDGERFAYNRAVTNVNVTNVRNVYVDKTVINNTAVNNNRTSFNGPGGVNRQPLPQEQAATREQHLAPLTTQSAHEQAAATNRGNLFAANHGRPALAAVSQAMAGSRGGAPNAQGAISRQTNPGGGGTRPLITAQHPNGANPPMNGANPPNGNLRQSGGNYNGQVQANNGTRAQGNYQPGNNQRPAPNAQQQGNNQRPAPNAQQQGAQQRPAPNAQQPGAQQRPRYNAAPERQAQGQYHPAPQQQARPEHSSPPVEHGGGERGGNDHRR